MLTLLVIQVSIICITMFCLLWYLTVHNDTRAQEEKIMGRTCAALAIMTVLMVPPIMILVM